MYVPSSLHPGAPGTFRSSGLRPSPSAQALMDEPAPMVKVDRKPPPPTYHKSHGTATSSRDASPYTGPETEPASPILPSRPASVSRPVSRYGAPEDSEMVDPLRPSGGAYPRGGHREVAALSPRESNVLLRGGHRAVSAPWPSESSVSTLGKTASKGRSKPSYGKGNKKSPSRREK